MGHKVRKFQRELDSGEAEAYLMGKLGALLWDEMIETELFAHMAGDFE